MLLLGLLPWGQLEQGTKSVNGTSISAPQTAVVVTLLLAQIYATTTSVEAEPFLSHFPMYSGTFESPAAYDRQMQYNFTRVLSVTADGDNRLVAFRQLRDDDRISLSDYSEGTASVDNEGDVRRLRRACAAYARQLGTHPATLQLEIERSGFDWTAGVFRPYRPIPSKPIPLAHLCRQLK
jgi:hypothetical protein